MQYVTTAERIGIEKGIEQGLEKGIEQGIEKGIEKGRRENAEKTARHLLSLNLLTEEQIARATELSVEEVQQLKAGE